MIDKIDERLTYDSRKHVAAPELWCFAHFAVIWKPIGAVGLHLFGRPKTVIECKSLYLRDKNVGDILTFNTGQRLQEEQCTTVL